jgi:hypothetical protein
VAVALAGRVAEEEIIISSLVGAQQRKSPSNINGADTTLCGHNGELIQWRYGGLRVRSPAGGKALPRLDPHEVLSTVCAEIETIGAAGTRDGCRRRPFFKRCRQNRPSRRRNPDHALTGEIRTAHGRPGVRAWPDFFFQNRCRPPSEQFYTDCWRQWAQTPQLKATRSREGSMSKADQFREYAEEAMRWAHQSKTEKERQALIELACTWTQAAVQSEHIFGVNDSPPEHRAL